MCVRVFGPVRLFRDPVDCSPPGSSVRGVLQARILEWDAISSSRGSSQPRDWTHVTCVSWTVAGRVFTTEPPGKPPVSLWEEEDKTPEETWRWGTQRRTRLGHRESVGCTGQGQGPQGEITLLTAPSQISSLQNSRKINLYISALSVCVSHSVVSDSCDPMDCSPPGSSALGILQARILEWVATSFSRGSSPPRDRTQVSRRAGRLLTIWARREALSPPVCGLLSWPP